MRNALFAVVFVLAAVVAYDWYQDSKYVRILKADCVETEYLRGIDPGFGDVVPMPIEPYTIDPTPDLGPPDYEDENFKIWKGQTMSIPPAVIPTPTWHIVEHERDHHQSSIEYGPLDDMFTVTDADENEYYFYYDELSNCWIEISDDDSELPVQKPLKVNNCLIFYSGGKEHEIDCDDSTINRQNWPECWSMPSSGWHINLCYGDEVIYTFR